MILSTDDPQVAPAINSLSLEYEDALLRGAQGQIEPREAQPNADTRFTAGFSKGETITIPVAHHDGNYFVDGLDNNEQMYDFDVRLSPRDFSPAALRRGN